MPSLSDTENYVSAWNLEYWNSHREQLNNSQRPLTTESYLSVFFSSRYQILPRLLGALALFLIFTLKIGTLQWDIKGFWDTFEIKRTDEHHLKPYYFLLWNGSQKHLYFRVIKRTKIRHAGLLVQCLVQINSVISILHNKIMDTIPY